MTKLIIIMRCIHLHIHTSHPVKVYILIRLANYRGEIRMYCPLVNNTAYLPLHQVTYFVWPIKYLNHHIIMERFPCNFQPIRIMWFLNLSGGTIRAEAIVKLGEPHNCILASSAIATSTTFHCYVKRKLCIKSPIKWLCFVGWQIEGQM